MDKCELSIIIPIYNGARFLKDTLDSVLNQTYRNYELILVDDGSTDDTALICAEYAAKDARIRVHHQKNGGMSNARDNGYKMAREGTWIAFLDADDIFHTDMFQDMMEHRDSDIVSIVFKNVLSSKIANQPFDIRKNRVEHLSGKEMLCRMFESKKNEGDFSIVGMLIKREFYEKIKEQIYDAKQAIPQNYLNDIYCVPRFFFNACTVTLLNNAYMFHRISKHTDSRRIKPNALHYESALVSKMNLDYYRQCGFQFAYEKQIIGFYLVILKLWYQIITSEDDWQKKKKYVILIQRYYKKYYDELKLVKCNTMKERVIKWTILLWGFDRTLWRMSVGNIRYGLMYKIQA